MRLDVDFAGDLPDGWAVLEATTVVKLIDAAGEVRLHQASTEAVSAWEVAGMLLWALDGTRGDLRDATEDGP